MFQKILILQTAFTGDVVLAIPLARAAKEAFPQAEVHFLVRPDIAVLLKHNPFIDKVWTYDKRRSEKGMGAFLRQTKMLRKTGFDLALIPHRSIRSAMLVWGAKIPRRIGFHRSGGAFLFTDIVPYPTDIHEIERNLKLLQVLGWNGKIPRPEIFPGPDEKREIKRFFDEMRIEIDQPIVAVAPGSVWPTKRWLPERFAEVTTKIWEKWGIHSILVGGKEDTALANEVMEKGGEGTANAVARFSLLASAELISRSKVLMSNDSAPLHLAVAVNTPVVAIFGPTVPIFGFAPYGTGNKVIQKNLECRPCSIHGGQRCPKKHFRCMREISSSEVLRTLEDYLA